jgi:hypothetical protein
MLDVLGILVSGVMMLFVILRAVQLDRSQPWFETPPPEPAEAAAAPRPGRPAMPPARARPIPRRGTRR